MESSRAGVVDVVQRNCTTGAIMAAATRATRRAAAAARARAAAAARARARARPRAIQLGRAQRDTVISHVSRV
jgi:hypothetical protein